MELLVISFGFAASVWVGKNMFLSILERFKFKKIISKLMPLLCLKCLTFWICLFVSQSIMIAAIAALFAYIIDVYTSEINFD